MSLIHNSRVNLLVELSPTNVDSLTSVFLDFLKPDGSNGFFVAVPVPGTTTALVEVQNNELDQVGNWQFQSYAESIDGNFHGLPFNEVVLATIRPPGHVHV